MRQQDALNLLASGALGERRFDIVFIDPPFELGLQSEVLGLLHQHPCLNPGALIYMETDQRDLSTALVPGWQIDRQKRAGNVSFGLLSPVPA